MKPENLVIGIVALSGGEIVGRTRLQKTAYLLDACGMRSGLEFDYHYYGPYAFALADGWALAARQNRLTHEERENRHLIPYSIFRTKEPPPPQLGRLSGHKAAEILARLKNHQDYELELAATMHFLARAGFDDPIAEVKQRKPLKATPERLAGARKLLSELGLSLSHDTKRIRKKAPLRTA